MVQWALKAEIVENNNDILQVRWKTDSQNYFGGEVLGLRIGEPLEQAKMRLPNLTKVTETDYRYDYSKDWHAFLTSHDGKTIDDIAVNNSNYSVQVHVIPK